LGRQTRFQVASNIVAQLSLRLQMPLTLDEKEFHRHYDTRLALPLPVAENLGATQIARLQEQSGGPVGLDMEIIPVRTYPSQTTAAHLLGHLQRDDSSVSNEVAFFTYRLPDWRGIVGVEHGFDKDLRGKAGAKSVLVNHLGYRQSQNIWSAVEPGQNVVLTIDYSIQQAAEQALRRPFGTETRGAAVVMDVRNGDILALASSPAYNPNQYVKGISRAEAEKLSDPKQRPEINRATQENYAPGSIFKIVVAMAALENKLDPSELYRVEPNPANPSKGFIKVGKQVFHDTVTPGDYDFRKAFIHSSNCYFITNGIRAGIKNIIRIGQKLHLGERTGLPTRQDVAGNLPSLKRVSEGWFNGNTANVCIGQDPILVTPIQMAVMTAAVANGGKVLVPRIVDRIEPQDVVAGQSAAVYPRTQVRDELGVSERTLKIIRAAMLADVEDSDGTGSAAAVHGMRICGKTGTAQVEDSRGKVVDHTTWFVSFAPYENPRYVVVVMVESGGSGGGTCAPIAKEIYIAIQKREKMSEPKTTTLSQAK
jgi:penicillin-binding protein 2